MINRLYIHNFRCLENFELRLQDLSSALLIGKNGTGKSTVRAALGILQSVGRGENRLGKLVRVNDFTRGRTDTPIRFEIDVLIGEKKYQYILALELPENFIELRILEEKLTVAGATIYSRKQAQVTLQRSHEVEFSVDWHQVVLPFIQVQSESDPIQIFKTWLARMILLSPIPSLMNGESKGDTLEPKHHGTNFGEWFSGILLRYPAAYKDIEKFLKPLMPDIEDFQNDVVGTDVKNLSVKFQKHTDELRILFKDLSDGEKCFFLAATVLAANKAYGPLLCFWDEPDNYLSISEIGHFAISLRRAFGKSGQFLASSHNPEIIQKFSDENTFMLYRNSRLEPVLVRSLSEVSYDGLLADALVRGDIEEEYIK